MASNPNQTIFPGPPWSGARPPHPTATAHRPRSVKTRTSHACNRCRTMRTKCSGGERCVKCTKDDADCAYGDRKRERNRNLDRDLADSLERIDLLEGENQVLLSSLRSLTASPFFQPAEHSDIVDLLSKYSSQEISDAGPTPSTQPNDRVRPKLPPSQTAEPGPFSEGAPLGETKADSSVGSPGRQGELSRVVDLDLGRGASGFVGKMSEMAWIQRAWEHSIQPSLNPTNDLPRAEFDHQISAAKDFTYYLDDTNVLSIDEDHVDERSWPPFNTALILTEAYFHAMQGAFSFIQRDQFLDDLVNFPREQSVWSWAERRWLSLANLVWAIGSKWLHIAKLHHDTVEDHLVYYARTRALGLDHRVVFDHPDVPRVQAIGLLAFYLLINGSIARSWNTLGHATRHATALGLHLRVSDPRIDQEDRERRARTWYSLYSLEVFLSEITGRPKSISLSDVTVEIGTLQRSERNAVEPSNWSSSISSHLESRKTWIEFLNLDRDTPQGMTGGIMPWKSFASVGQSASPLHFPQRILLCQLSAKIASQLYSGALDETWSQVQRKIGELQTELRRWEDNLPENLTIQSKGPTDSDPRVKIELNMYYHSLQMILHRPCLCEVVIENESDRSQEFNRSCARACVHAAMSMLAIMPSNPSAHEAYQLLPWWTLLHYVAQTAAVLLLELSLDCQHFEGEESEVTEYLRKAMAYLWCMTEGSPSAYRAWRIYRRVLTDVSRHYEDLNVADIPEQARVPERWTMEDEELLEETFSYS